MSPRRVSVQRVSLEQVVVAARAGDAAAAPHTAAVADLVLLHTDVDMHRLITDESITLYEESAALHTLWQLVQRHQLEDAEPMDARVRSQRWTRAHRDYLDSGRHASLVVLQRRWHELKLQARVRLAAHWRRTDPLCPAPAPPTAPDSAPALAPHELYPRPAPIHIAILKRYPHVATGAFKSWRQQVLDGAVVTEPVEEDAKSEDEGTEQPEETDPLELDDKLIIPKTERPDADEQDTDRTAATEPGVDPLADDTTDSDQKVVDETPVEATCKPVVKLTTTGDPEAKKLTVNNLTTVKPSVEPMDTDILSEESDSLTANPKVKVEKDAVIDPATDSETAQLTVKDFQAVHAALDTPMMDICDVLDGVSTAEHISTVKPAVNGLKVEQDTVNDPSAQPPANDLLVVPPDIFKRMYNNLLDEQGSTDDPLLLKEPKIEPITDENHLDDNPVTGETKNSANLVEQPTVHKPEVVTTENELSLVQSKVDNALPEKRKDSILLALLTADCKLPAKKSRSNLCKTRRYVETLVTQRGRNAPSGVVGRTDVRQRRELSSERTRHDEDKSDTDSEDNLVIDECSNNTPCVLQPVPTTNTETHGADTVSPHTTLRNTDATIQELQMIDPSRVKKEILFESDEEESRPCVGEHKVDIDIKKEVPSMASKIVFVNEEVRIKTEVEDTECMDGDKSPEGDGLGDNAPAIDPLLLMDTKVRVFRIDKTRVWKTNVRKDNSIKVSRIHRRWYTPSSKKYYHTPVGSNKSKTKKNTRLKPANRKIKPKTSNNTSNTNEQNTQEINIDNACLEQVANTDCVKELCRNIKREMIDDVLEDEIPKKRIKTESDEEETETAIRDGLGQREIADVAVEIELVEELSSDDEGVDEEVSFSRDRGDKKKNKAPTRAASSTTWSSTSAPAAGARVAKRVTLPDRNTLRRDAGGTKVAQVKPIKNRANTKEKTGKDSKRAEKTADAADDDTPLAWRALDLPATDQLDAVLDELTLASSVEHALERAHCCAARRHREVNDTRRRIGAPDLPLHTHPDGVCTCCCAHLSDSDARARLDAQLRALHSDIERMLWKTANGKTQPKPALKRSRSPSPTSTTVKPDVKNIPLVSSVEVKSSKSKPVKPVPAEAKVAKAKTTTHTTKSKKRRSKRAPTPPPEEPAPIVDYYEEWQRQKTMNAQYFHIKGNNPSKKKKNKPPQTVAQTSTPQNLASNTTPLSVAQSCTPQTMVQSTIPQNMVQGTIPQNIVQGTIPQNMVQGTIPQNMVQGTIPQNSVQGTIPQNMVQSTIPQNVVQNMTRQSIIAPSTVAGSIVPAQNTPTGLMPYIRESRLIAPAGPAVTHAIEVPSLVPVIYPQGFSRVLLATPQQLTTPSPLQRNTIRHIAPKPEKPEEKPQTNPQLSNPFTNQPPQPSTSEPVKPVSILEEYSRTLTTEAARNMGAINALSLRVPDGPQGPKTTIVMALNIPSEKIIKKTINCLYANETVDLTNEAETPSVVSKPPEVQKPVTPVCDIVGVVQGLLNAGNQSNISSLSLHCTASTSLGNQDKPSEAPTPRKKTPQIMSLTKTLRAGDVIDITDTDSNDSNGSHSSNSTIPMKESSDATVYGNKKSVSSNEDKKTSELTKSSDTKTGSQNTDVCLNKVINATETKSDDSHSHLQNTEGGKDKTVATNTNKRDDQRESNNKKYLRDTTTDSEASEATAPAAGKAAAGAKKPGRYRWHNMLDMLPDASEDPNYAGIQTLKSLIDDSQRCVGRYTDARAMPDFVAKLRDNADKEGYCHKSSATTVAVSALPCGTTLLCVDAASPPLVLQTQDEPRYKSIPHLRAHLVLTDADLPCTQPTYWTLASFRHMARVVPDAPIPDLHDALVVPVDASWSQEKKQWVPGQEGRKICEKKHGFKVLTAFCTADGVRQAARAGATLFLLNVLRARVLVLAIERVQGGWGRHRHRAVADVDPEILRVSPTCRHTVPAQRAARARARARYREDTLFLLNVLRARVLVLAIERVQGGWGRHRHRAVADVDPEILRVSPTCRHTVPAQRAARARARARYREDTLFLLNVLRARVLVLAIERVQGGWGRHRHRAVADVDPEILRVSPTCRHTVPAQRGARARARARYREDTLFLLNVLRARVLVLAIERVQGGWGRHRHRAVADVDPEILRVSPTCRHTVPAQRAARARARARYREDTLFLLNVLRARVLVLAIERVQGGWGRHRHRAVADVDPEILRVSPTCRHTVPAQRAARARARARYREDTLFLLNVLRARVLVLAIERVQGGWGRHRHRAVADVDPEILRVSPTCRHTVPAQRAARARARARYREDTLFLLNVLRARVLVLAIERVQGGWGRHRHRAVADVDPEILRVSPTCRHTVPAQRGARARARARYREDTLFLLNVLRARVLVLAIERVQGGWGRHRHRAVADVDPEILRRVQGGWGRHRHRAVADVDPEILRVSPTCRHTVHNLEELIDEAEMQEERDRRNKVNG
ncbi:hypothetical protein PYW07_011593 [Mythimna separata]|uniref:Uncharacterized protein n=1 Tax=Mythimna separata TaxID=271217 RepID=A0AAD7Y6W8_MYTSE|nr:hypothetical protein PYW07_011593 [Mythimna separata]